MSISEQTKLSLTMTIAEWTVLVGVLRSTKNPQASAWAVHLEQLAGEQDR